MCSTLETMIIAALGLWIAIVLIGGGVAVNYYITEHKKGGLNE